MSYHKDTPSTAIEKLYDYLRKMSPDVGGGESASGDGRRLYQQATRYARVPSRPALSVSTTSTSLATTCGSQATLAAHAYLPVPRAEDPDEGASSDDDERAPFGFTAPQKPITIKDRNLRNFGQPAMASAKGHEGTINGDSSPYKPTTQKIYLVTQMLATLAVSCGSMIVGYSSAYTSPALVTMMSENSTLNTMTAQQASWVGGIMPLTALGGGIIGGLLVELIGRRTTLIAIAAPFVLSWMLIANSVNVAMLLVGRAICGFCVGIGSLAFPVYLGETLQPEVRGALGIVPTCFGNIGILVCFIAGKYFDWSGLAFIGGALPFVFIALMLMIPETPRWFVSKGQNDKAERSLRWLRGKDADIDHELHELLHVNNESTSLFEIVSDTKYIRAVLISLGLMFFQQMSGINAVIFYTVQIFHDAGSDSIDENTCTIIVGIVNFASTFIASFLIDRLGRKVLLYISSVSMIATLSALGAFFFVKSRGYDVSSFGWLPLASFVVYVIGFSCGFGPIPWLMMGEILPSKIRGVAASICTGFNWTCTFVVTKMFADMVYLMGTHGTFLTFGILCLFGLFFVIFFVPETRGRTLEDIELKLTGMKKATLNSINC